METLKKHNMGSRYGLNEPKANAGVLCDECSAEMMHSCPGIVNTSMPPSQNVYCPACGASGVKR